MNPAGSTGQGWRWLRATYLACFCCLLILGGYAGRGWYAGRRGIEPVTRTGREARAGINVDLAQYGPEALEQALDDLESLGFYWLRQRFPWQAIEPQAGLYDWAAWDRLVEAVRAHDLALIAVLDDPPAWAARGDRPPLPCEPPWDVAAYARFAAALARRYGDQIDHYQIWDEPNLSRAWGGGHPAPCGYVALLQAAYTAVHTADANANVLGGGLAPTQAPGPDNLSDLTYLRRFYALGGGAYLDILAVKPYGFWSGPDDRRVKAEQLNFSRLVAVRELAHSRGQGEVPIWAVEWGWHTSSPGQEGAPPAWGTDTLAVQEHRIRGAVERARAEWPWLEVMVWAEYQPDLPAADPRWGFALRDPSGAPAPLYEVMRAANAGLERVPYPLPWPAQRQGLAIGLPLAAGVSLVALGSRLHMGSAAGRAWRRWAELPPALQLTVLAGLGALCWLTPWGEWVLVELVLAGVLLYAHPCWPLVGAVFTIPLASVTRPVGPFYLAPPEVLLLLSAAVIGARLARSGLWRGLVWSGAALDGAWIAWAAWGLLSPGIAPDPALAWHEWRLCLFDPALLYLLIGLAQAVPDRPEDRSDDPYPVHRELLVAWGLSAAAVALGGLAQWVLGALVPAMRVARVSSLYFSPNHLALYLGRVWPVFLALLACTDLPRPRRPWVWGGAVTIGAGLYLTYSRGAWLLAVPAAVLAGAWLCRRYLRWWMVAVAAGALLLVASNVLGGRAGAGELWDEIRLPVWGSAWRMLLDHPWTGVGLDGFQFIYPRYMQPAAWTEPLLYHPHNMWLDAAVRLGLPGLALFATLISLILRQVSRRVGRESGVQRALAIGCLAGLLAALAHGLVDSGYFLPDLAWSWALVAGLARWSPGAVLRPQNQEPDASYSS